MTTQPASKSNITVKMLPNCHAEITTPHGTVTVGPTELLSLHQPIFQALYGADMIDMFGKPNPLTKLVAVLESNR